MLLKWSVVFYLALFVIFLLLILHCILKCAKVQAQRRTVFVISSPKLEPSEQDLPPSYSQANTLKITEIKPK